MKRILLVEDDLSLIIGLSFAVKKQGYDLNIARTSCEAEKSWTSGKYDLVILDVSLPDGSGFDICKKIRQTSKIPIIRMYYNIAKLMQMIMKLFLGLQNQMIHI